MDSLFAFVSRKDHVDLCLTWLETGHITAGADGAKLYELKQVHKHSILRKLFGSRDFEAEFKHATLDKIVGEDKSDLVENLRASCQAAMPDAQIKAQVWKDISDPHSTESLYSRVAKMGCFY